jgi:poly-gamma-glutamate biosynthesis protein PgsC/CapC
VHDYLFSSEIVRFAFVFGICVSMMLYERVHLTTGSIVVPGYIAVFLVYPMVVVATFANALISYALMNHVIRKRFILYGRAKFTLMALISIAIQTIMLKLTPSGPWLWEKNIPLFVGAGYVVPALIAHDMGRQGIKRTTKAVLIAGVIVAVPIGLALVLRLPGVHDLAPLAGFGTMSIVSRWIPFAVLLSAAGAWGVANNYNLKSGGFVGAAYIGMFMGDPYQVAVAFTIAFVTFIIVRYGLMNILILFGRRKFSAMLLTSSMISWTLLWCGQSIFSARVVNHLDLASMALTPLFVPGLLANDMDRTSPLRVVAGVGMAASFVVPTTWWMQTVIEGGHLGLQWKLLSVGMFAAIFWKTARQLYRHYRPKLEAAPAEHTERSQPVDSDGENPWSVDDDFSDLVSAAEFDFDREFEFEFGFDTSAQPATSGVYDFQREFGDLVGSSANDSVFDDFDLQTEFGDLLRPAVTNELALVAEAAILHTDDNETQDAEVFEPAMGSELLAGHRHVTQPLVAVVAEPTWPEVDRRKGGRPWGDHPAVIEVVAEDVVEDWHDLLPTVLSIDSTGWSVKGNKRWQDQHPDVWDEADLWLADALAPEDDDVRVA